ncbi:class I SAM-dependent methyltransferase [Pectinatus frisingensis]|jgi:16S rRNA G966 N2-methylase RsmD|uniref:class I SAM-dependent methyltransferase n=1 Tax=Pectinatus frisingensis TaxID=865 RepID=UPI0015F5CE70|nr:class I SAM-dependent methyltransferase [Pectinatus frisingensis]
MDKFFITTGRNTNASCIKKAELLAAQHNVPFIFRSDKSLQQLKAEQTYAVALLVKKTGLYIDTPNGTIFFHPNMAQLRIKKLLENKPDNMITAMDLRRGMSVLDCTLGFASDALVSAFICKTPVIGLESSSLLYAVITDGLQNFSSNIPNINEAARLIKPANLNHIDYLKKLPNKSIDIVYFDPMFRHPLMNSTNLQPLRCLADTAPVTSKSIHEACRIARHRVVLKENSKSHEFLRLGFKERIGSRYSSVHYGIIKIE